MLDSSLFFNKACRNRILCDFMYKLEEKVGRNDFLISLEK